jgi:hypothetical protein
MEYNDNAPIDLLVEIEKRKDAYFFLCDYIEAKYGEPSLLKLEDDLHEEAHPSPPSHEPLLHNISELEKDEEWMPHVENVKEMYDVIKKKTLLKKGLKKHLILLLKMMIPLNILLHLLKKKTLMKNLFMLPLKIKRHLMIHLKVKYMKRTLVKTLMVRASKHRHFSST